MFAPPVPPVRRTTAGQRVAVAVLVVLVLVAALLAAVDVVAVSQRAQASFIPAGGSRTEAVKALMTRRAKAVMDRDEKAFLATADNTRPAFVDRQRTEFRNLVALGLSSFTLDAEPNRLFKLPAQQSGLAGLADGPTAIGVTVRYAVNGLDAAPVAEPWVPVLGQRDGRWLVLDEVNSGDVPTGTGGLPWQTGTIEVRRTQHVVAVVSADDPQLADHLLDLAETGLSRVAKVRPDGWPGKVLVTAVTDGAVFRSYFREDPEHVRQVAAIAVSTFDRVPQWSASARYVTTRVLFNPDTFGDGDDELLHTFTHEFTHAATGPVTVDSTPTWLVEGTAEYVAYQSEGAGDGLATRLLRRTPLPGALPGDDTFYDSADNYTVSWLACRLIASRYGQAKLFALYQYFNDHDGKLDDALRATIGIGAAQFTDDWITYLTRLRG